jgi:hypothetical protein
LKDFSFPWQGRIVFGKGLGKGVMGATGAGRKVAGKNYFFSFFLFLFSFFFFAPCAIFSLHLFYLINRGTGKGGVGWLEKSIDGAREGNGGQQAQGAGRRAAGKDY